MNRSSALDLSSLAELVVTRVDALPKPRTNFLSCGRTQNWLFFEYICNSDIGNPIHEIRKQSGFRKEKKPGGVFLRLSLQVRTDFGGIDHFVYAPHERCGFSVVSGYDGVDQR